MANTINVVHNQNDLLGGCCNVRRINRLHSGHLPSSANPRKLYPHFTQRRLCFNTMSTSIEIVSSQKRQRHPSGSNDLGHSLAAIVLLFLTTRVYSQQSSQVPCSQAFEGGIAYEIETHSALTEAALTNDQSHIHTFLQDELLIQSGLLHIAVSDGVSYTLLRWAREGSKREDDGLRALRNYLITA